MSSEETSPQFFIKVRYIQPNGCPEVAPIFYIGVLLLKPLNWNVTLIIATIEYIKLLPSNSGHGLAPPIGQSLLSSSDAPISIPPVQSITAYHYFSIRCIVY